jgi:hypothetical protein
MHRTIARMVEEALAHAEQGRPARAAVTGLAFIDHGHHEPWYAGSRFNDLIVDLGGWCRSLTATALLRLSASERCWRPASGGYSLP